MRSVIAIIAVVVLAGVLVWAFCRVYSVEIDGKRYTFRGVSKRDFQRFAGEVFMRGVEIGKKTSMDDIRNDEIGSRIMQDIQEQGFCLRWHQ